MAKEGRYIKWLSELSKEDVKLVGGKGSNLGEMYNSKMPVPQAFVVSTLAYSEFLKETGLRDRIKQRLSDLDEENTEQLEDISSQIREMIEAEEIPEQIRKEILEAYENLSIDKEALKKVSKDALAILSRGFEMAFVAVRSSATAEDSSETSFAGQNETFLNIKGKSDLIEAVRKCWASLFTARSIYYRIKNKLIGKDVLIAVIVEVMVNSDKSGVIFSQDPINESKNIIIEAVFGLGEGIVSGKIKPDNYVVSREIKILKKDISEKKIAIARNSAGETETVKLTEERGKSQVLSEYEIKKLADYAIQLEEHYQLPQDIEFAIDSGVIYIVQTRPITTLGKRKQEETGKGEVLLSGLAASPGKASGIVKIVRSLEDLKKIKKGDILVTKMTNPDMVVTMQKSAAIVTDEGGLTCHTAIVAREMGIAAVVGTGNATQILKEGMKTTVDGSNGKIYAGEIETHKAEIKKVVETKTKIKVMVDLPDFAVRAAKTGIKEVGLVRLEGIIAEAGKHPYLFLKQNIKEYEEIIYSGINRIGKYFDKLWIRTSDIRSDEYGDLPGAPKKENNPMLGLHGIRDSLIHSELLKAELKALARLSKQGKKIGILLPQLILVDELRQVKKILEELEIELELGVMIETPAAVEIIEDLCKEGIDFISFGTNDLTQYTLAIDRGNEDVQYLYDEMNSAVLRQLAYVIRICKKHGVETSICGQAGSKKEMVEFLVKHGIDSISVNADVAGEISEFVAELEEKGLRGSELKNGEQVEEAREKVEASVEKETENKIKTKEQEEFPEFELNVDIFEPAEKKVEKRETREKVKDAEELVEEAGEYVREEKEKVDQKREYVEEDVENRKNKELEKEKKKKTERKTYPIVCSICSKQAEVPFEPDGIRPVYCQACYKLGEKGREKLMQEKEKAAEKLVEEIEEEGEEAEEVEEEVEPNVKRMEDKEIENKDEQVEESFYVEGAKDLDIY